MKNQFKRRLSGLLALLLLFLAGCTGVGGKPSARAMGRYVEKELALPTPEFGVMAFQGDKDGSLNLLGAVKEGKYLIFQCYRSADGGGTWTEQSLPVLDEINSEDCDLQLEAAAWAPDGTLWLSCARPVEDEYTSFFAKILPDGTREERDWPVPSASDGSGMRSFQVTEGGDILIDCWVSLYLLDGVTGTIQQDFSPPPGLEMSGYTANGNSATVSQGDTLLWYDLESGKQTSKVTCPAAAADTTISSSSISRLLTAHKDEQILYADAKGLFRAQADNQVIEQLADGSLISLNTPSLALFAIAAVGDGIQVMTWENERFRLLSYTYDPEVPTLPEQAITVWSLSDSADIRQTMGVFQQQHPEVQVDYQAGIPAESGITRDDALRTLNPQLTAGKGPDVLLMDGMDLNSYIEKGVLSDLSSLLSEYTDAGTVLKNQAGAFLQEDDTCYAIPTRFTVPMMHGTTAAIAEIRSLTTMADWLERNRNSFAHPFARNHPTTLLRSFYPLCASGMTGADGNVDTTALSAFLSDLGRIYALEKNTPEYDIGDQALNFTFGSLNWIAGAAGLNIGSPTVFNGIYAPYQAGLNKGDGAMDTLFHRKGFTPVAILGVNARSPQPALAQDFIRAALSETVQKADLETGMPVNLAAFDLSIQSDPSRVDNGLATYGTTLVDAEGADVPVNLMVYYPPEEYRQAMSDQMKALDTPLTYDATILQILIDNTADYFSGKSTLEATMEAVMAKLALYQAE